MPPFFQSSSFIGIIEGANAHQKNDLQGSQNTSTGKNRNPKNLDQSGSGKKYDTFSSEAKKNIPRKVKNLCRVFGYVKNQKNFAKEFKLLKPNARDRILKRIIPQYKPQFDPKDPKQMKQMLRGNPVVYRHQIPYFRHRVIEIIRGLPNKNFSAFREKVVDVIRHIRAKKGRQMEDDVFQVHFWTEFKEKNPIIRDLWEALPPSNATQEPRAPQRMTSLSSGGQSTMPSTPSTLMMPLFPENSPSPSQSEEFMSLFDRLDVIEEFDHYQLQFNNGNNKSGYHYHHEQNNQVPEEADNNILLFREINDNDAYQKRVFGGLDNGTFPLGFLTFPYDQ